LLIIGLTDGTLHASSKPYILPALFKFLNRNRHPSFRVKDQRYRRLLPESLHRNIEHDRETEYFRDKEPHIPFTERVRKYMKSVIPRLVNSQFICPNQSSYLLRYRTISSCNVEMDDLHFYPILKQVHTYFSSTKLLPLSFEPTIRNISTVEEVLLFEIQATQSYGTPKGMLGLNM
jgi:hypothetical protein